MATKVGEAAAGAGVVSAPVDAAVKKNTDCVYFLASPLTCKKGADCEFRHSEAARINPRDCWFWLSGSCLNRDCGYRHPPLEVEATTPTATPAPQNNRGRTPCYFFSHGYCAKGDRCPFLHGAPVAASKVTVPPEVEAPPPRTDAPAPAAKLASQKPVIDGELQTADAAAAVPESRPAAVPHALKPAAAVPQLPKSTALVSKAATSPPQVSKPAAAPPRVAKPAAAQVSRSAPHFAKPVAPLQAVKPVVQPQVAKPAQVAKPVQVDRKIRQTENGNGVARRSRSLGVESEDSPEPLSTTHEDDLHMVDSRLENGVGEPEERWEEASPGFDVLVDDGPEQIRYRDEAVFHHGNGEDADDDFEFQYSDMYNQSGPALYGHERYDRVRFDHSGLEPGEYTDYDAPYSHRPDFDRPVLEQPNNDYFQATREVRTQSIKDRLRFNNHRDSRPFLDNGDLRNLLERRRRLDAYRSDDRPPREFLETRERHRDDYVSGRERDRTHQSLFQQGRLSNDRRSRERSNELFHHRAAEAVVYRERMPVNDPSPSAYDARSLGNGFGRGPAEGASDFAAPKSLAQIRAEKRKFDGDNITVSSKRGFSSRESRFSAEVNGGGGDDRQHFESPRPLHEILKDKRRDTTLSQPRMSNSGNHDTNMVRADLVDHGSQVREPGLTNGVANHVVYADINNTTTTHQDEAFDEDDEDDFAKKLGGFFS